jgi:hypothetical protein
MTMGAGLPANQVGCDLAQGYYISRPLSGEDALAWARKIRAEEVTGQKRGRHPKCREGLDAGQSGELRRPTSYKYEIRSQFGPCFSRPALLTTLPTAAPPGVSSGDMP